MVLLFKKYWRAKFKEADSYLSLSQVINKLLDNFFGLGPFVSPLIKKRRTNLGRKYTTKLGAIMITLDTEQESPISKICSGNSSG
jgi:hypothetical protein